MTPFRKLVALLTLFAVAVLMYLLLAAAASAGDIGAVELLVWLGLLLVAEIGVMYALGRAFARRDRRRAVARDGADEG